MGNKKNKYSQASDGDLDLSNDRRLIEEALQRGDTEGADAIRRNRAASDRRQGIQTRSKLSYRQALDAAMARDDSEEYDRIYTNERDLGRDRHMLKQALESDDMDTFNRINRTREEGWNRAYGNRQTHTPDQLVAVEEARLAERAAERQAIVDEAEARRVTAENRQQVMGGYLDRRARREIAGPPAPVDNYGPSRGVASPPAPAASPGAMSGGGGAVDYLKRATTGDSYGASGPVRRELGANITEEELRILKSQRAPWQ